VINDLSALLRLHELEFGEGFSKRQKGSHFTAEIERCKAQLDDDLLERYDMLKGRFGKNVVSTIQRNTCSGCYLTLPTSGLRVVGENIYICEHCGRLLYDASCSELVV